MRTAKRETEASEGFSKKRISDGGLLLFGINDTEFHPRRRRERSFPL